MSSFTLPSNRYKICQRFYLFSELDTTAFQNEYSWDCVDNMLWFSSDNLFGCCWWKFLNIFCFWVKMAGMMSLHVPLKKLNEI